MVFGKGEVRHFNGKIKHGREKTPFGRQKTPFGRVKKTFQKHKCVHISDKHTIVGKLFAAKNKCILDEKTIFPEKTKNASFRRCRHISI